MGECENQVISRVTDPFTNQGFLIDFSLGGRQTDGITLCYRPRSLYTEERKLQAAGVWPLGYLMHTKPSRPASPPPPQIELNVRYSLCSEKGLQELRYSEASVFIFQIHTELTLRLESWPTRASSPMSPQQLIGARFHSHSLPTLLKLMRKWNGG